MTRPITTAESNPKEKEVTITLEEELKRQGTFENEQEARTRWVSPVSLPPTRFANIIHLNLAEKSFWERLQR